VSPGKSPGVFKLFIPYDSMMLNEQRDYEPVHQTHHIQIYSRKMMPLIH